MKVNNDKNNAKNGEYGQDETLEEERKKTYQKKRAFQHETSMI